MQGDDRFIEDLRFIVEGLAKEGLAVKSGRLPPALGQAKLLKSGDGRAIVDAANTLIELGHPATDTLFMVMVTQRGDLITDNRVTVMGQDLQELSPGRHCFAFVILACSPDPSESDRRALLRTVSRCDLLDGCTARVCSGKIWLRFSQDAISKGVTLETLGEFLIGESRKSQTRLRKMEIVFVVGGKHDIERLRPVADGLIAERSERYKVALADKTQCETGLDCNACPETEVCKVLKDAVALRRRKQKVAEV